jgi:hypothetical protein
MLRSTNVKNSNSKYVIMWALQKQQNMTYVIVNTLNFYNLKICQILSILWSLEYKIFGIETFTLLEYNIAYT